MSEEKEAKPKKKTLILIDKCTGVYEVKSVTNSLAYSPRGQILAPEVIHLCDDEEWTVRVV